VVLEVGPGQGELTVPLSRKVKKVIAVEKDKELSENLRDRFSREKITNVEVVEGDILKYISESGKINAFRADKLISNIPYYLTSRLLKNVLESEFPPKMIVLTIQKEVAERICAAPPNMSILSVSVQSFGHPNIIKKVPAECFSPAPKIDSAIIKIDDISRDFFTKNGLNPILFFQMIKTTFSQKRKILLNPLSQFIGSKEIASEALKKASIAFNSRAQELSLEEWISLYKNIEPIKARNRE